MARYTGAVCRLCRREGEKLFLKGIRCSSTKCPLSKRSFPPGERHRISRKLSDYALQLREKQKVKRMYGVLERQFRGYFKIAARAKGATGEILLQLLERRLDNVIFRAGFGLSHAQARQIVRHNFVYVNQRRVNIPSFLIKTEDIVVLKKAKQDSLNFIKENIEISKERMRPNWLEVNPAQLEIKILRLPQKEDLQQPVQEQLIVELYSK
ncbi:MAG: 30S ribosomal protein S4 [Candidatus Omnitrophica bacterium]|nr:30S ribosomal protein S4 [Candidatus Omnitrophota bacterium]